MSNSSRIFDISVPSSTLSRPTPALLTRASIVPAVLTASAMLSALVTSSCRISSLSFEGRWSLRGVRMVATTSHPVFKNFCAMARPKPDEQPVMRIFGMFRLLTFNKAEDGPDQPDLLYAHVRDCLAEVRIDDRSGCRSCFLVEAEPVDIKAGDGRRSVAR
ncbi:hypothetical protein AGR1B_pAt30069 [Agrobacterium fabacearum S56]|nr:hypothetical protein AGR1B_pAt30069 [Agrobacterium fabacearum S56]